MKYWDKGKVGRGYEEEGILIKGFDRLLSVCKIDGTIQFREECDGYFHVSYTKEEALELIDELKNWISEQD